MSPLFVAVRRAALLCLPFAAIFVAGVTLSPHADAQYPGGGSGSGYPGGPAPGWHPVKPDGTLGNDVLSTDANFSVYDSTRLDVLRTGTNRTGSSRSTPGKYTPGKYTLGKYTPGTSGYYAGLITAPTAALPSP